MKSIFLVFVFSISCLSLISSDTISLPVVDNNAFQVGETLRYRVTYGFMDAGEAIMEVKETPKTFAFERYG